MCRGEVCGIKGCKLCTRGTAGQVVKRQLGSWSNLTQGVFTVTWKRTPPTLNVLPLTQASILAVSGATSPPPAYSTTSTDETVSAGPLVAATPPPFRFFFLTLSFRERLVAILCRALPTGSSLARRRRCSLPCSWKRRLIDSSPSSERTNTQSSGRSHITHGQLYGEL